MALYPRRDILKLSGPGLAAMATSALAAPPAPHKPPSSLPNFNVRNFGATGVDGKTMYSPAINESHRSRSVQPEAVLSSFLPALYSMCFSIRLKSNVELYLSQGSTILAADGPINPGDTTGYNGGKYDNPEPKTAWDAYQDFGHNHWHNSLFWGEDLHDLSITGPGLIWGKGLNAGHGNHVLPDGVGDKAIALKNCRNVNFRDFSILKGGHFGPPPHRRRQPHHRQPENRHRPRRHRHRLLPQRSRLQLHRQLTRRRRHLP